MNQIYILSAVSLKQNTQEDIQKQKEIHNLQYNRNDTLKDYVKWLAGIQQLRYHVDTYDTAYFEDLSTAMEYAKANMADINESGAYEYLAIYSRPLNIMYADAYDCEVHVFVYNKDTHHYDEITEETIEQLVIRHNFDIRLQHHTKLQENIEMYYKLKSKE